MTPAAVVAILGPLFVAACVWALSAERRADRAERRLARSTAHRRRLAGRVRDLRRSNARLRERVADLSGNRVIGPTYRIPHPPAPANPRLSLLADTTEIREQR